MKFDNLILDGAMGSRLLQLSGEFAPSESFNITHPELVYKIHTDYVKAGSNVIYSNTFGVNPFKVGDLTETLIQKGIEIAKQAATTENNVYVALDIGPTGKIIGNGSITFDQAYEAFARVIKAGLDQCDFLVLETFTDLCELRAAILAAKENSNLPIAVSMSFEPDGRTAFGCSVESFAITATSLKVDAVGINCSVGPVELISIFKKLRASTDLPTFVKPNAGMPRILGGRTVYSLSPDSFASSMVRLKLLGADMLGGCCGTTPEYIDALVKKTSGIVGTYTTISETTNVKLCSSSSVVDPENGILIGERINPTGKKVLQAAIKNRDIDQIVALGPRQEEEGADMLDVNLGMSGFDDEEIIEKVIDGLQRVTNAPICIDSRKPQSIEKGLRRFNGRALVNSVTGEKESLDTILPIVAKYGAAVIGLTLDENGIPETAFDRVKIAEKILSAARKKGIEPQDVYIDCLTMSEGAKRGSAITTLNALKEIKKLGCRTVLGVSNISFGLPAREDLNAAFLRLAQEDGLDAYIYNPKFARLEPSQQAIDYLLGKIEFEEYNLFVDSHTAPQIQESGETLSIAVRRGDVKSVKALVSKALAEKRDPSEELFEALDLIGETYEAGKLFLPQLIAAADAAKAGLDLLFADKGQDREHKGIFVLATVKGDVHDIGKNIVKAVVSNYGYKVVDLGKDVDQETIISAIKANYPCVLGLSALMTTTAVNMATIVAEVRKTYPDIEIIVGGAVITPDFAEQIGARYCKDAAAAVKELNSIYGIK